MRYKKSDIDRHSNDGYGAQYPAVNVKVTGRQIACTTEDIIAKFPDCSAEQAQKALEFAFEAECRAFWEYWTDASHGAENGLTESPDEPFAYFPGQHPHAHAVGRSAGWLIVQGLPPVEEWNGTMVARWGRFEKDVLADVEYHTSTECLLEGIECNEWYKEYSEQYNFCDGKDGKLVCMADVRQDVNAYCVRTHGMTLERVA